MRAGSLFSGYGGLDLAVEAVLGAQTVWQCEVEAAPSRVLAARWPGVPNLGDITRVDWTAVEPVGALFAGYPCQPFSQAGQRKGTDDARHLWPHVARAVRVLRPRLVVLENVSGHLSLGFGRVLGDLAGAGYDVRWCCVRAADVGAPHGRRRLFVVAAYAERGGWDGWPGEQRSGWWAEPADRREPATDTDVDGRWGWAEADTAGWQDGSGPRPDPARRGTDAPTDATRDQGWISDGNDGAAWGQYEPAIHRWERILGRSAPAPTELAPRGGQRLSPRFVEWLMGLPDGWVTDVPGVSRNEQLRMLGNGCVPQQVVCALQLLLGAMHEDVSALRDAI